MRGDKVLNNRVAEDTPGPVQLYQVHEYLGNDGLDHIFSPDCLYFSYFLAGDASETGASKPTRRTTRTRDHAGVAATSRIFTIIQFTFSLNVAIL